MRVRFLFTWEHPNGDIYSMGEWAEFTEELARSLIEAGIAMQDHDLPAWETH